MKNKLLKSEIDNKIKQVFSSAPVPKEIKKIKKLAMSKNIKLKKERKLFCKKCYSFFRSENSEIRIKKGFKLIKCKQCGFISRYKLKQK